MSTVQTTTAPDGLERPGGVPGWAADVLDGLLSARVLDAEQLERLDPDQLTHLARAWMRSVASASSFTEQVGQILSAHAERLERLSRKREAERERLARAA